MTAVTACACSWVFFFLPSHVFKALSSKKKSKGRKEAKPSKTQGRIHISNLCISSHILVHLSTTSQSLSVCVFFMEILCVVTTAEDDSDDMFKPPKMDEIDDDDDDDDFSPFGGSSRLFSGGKGLFDDDNDEVRQMLPLDDLNVEMQTQVFLFFSTLFSGTFSMMHQNLLYQKKRNL